MRISRLLLAGLVATAVTAAAPRAFASPSPGMAPMPHPSPPAALYHCTWTKRFGGGIGWTGDLTIRVNEEGIINGTYRSTSIKPDPFYGKIVTVTGGRTGKNIRLTFGIVPSVTVRGDDEGGNITGSATIGSTTYNFVANAAS